MLEPFKEEILFQVIEEIMATENLDHLSIEDQMLVFDTIAGSIRRYKGIEVKNFLDEMDNHYSKKLSDL